MNTTAASRESIAGRTCHLLGTPLALTSYEGLSARCQDWAKENRKVAVEFVNTQVVAMRRCDPLFRKYTRVTDVFAPDSMPVVWCLNFRGAGLKERVYGPAFMRVLLADTPAPFTHYFLGGSAEIGRLLRRAAEGLNPRVQVVGGYHGACRPDGELTDAGVIEEINRLSPDFIWVGLGTPKQQAWIHRYKDRLRRGVLLSVGFAFEVNAGTKRDAPLALQRLGLNWLFRMICEPRRLAGRYVRNNSIFLYYLMRDGLRGRCYASMDELVSPDDQP